MEKSPKKFYVPENIEDSFDESISSAPRCFKPGTIQEGLLESTNEKPYTSKESNLVQCNMTLGSSNSKFPDKIENNIPDNIKNVKKPQTRFESEFSNLRESKFYESQSKSIESSSSGNVQEKLPDKSRSFSALLVNPRQRGNPLLKHIRNVPWEFSEIEPDYVMGKSTCALFLSLRYHNLFPNYIHERLKALGKSYALRVLLAQVDVVEPNPPLKDLSVISILADCTLMVCWSAEEAGNYLETYKMYENKSADMIKEKQDNDNYSQLIDCLTTIRSINKTDAMVLLSTFKTLKAIIKASVDELAMCPGFGPLKAKRLYDALRKPLKNEKRN